MTAQVIEDVLPTAPADVWFEHTLSAVRKFLKSAVVIDNQPYVPQSAHDIPADPVPVPDINSGLGDEFEELVVPTASDQSALTDDALAHILDVRKVSDAFAGDGMACAFVLPDDSDPDLVSIEKRVLGAAKISDVVVIDWYLRDNVPVLTLELLEKIAVDDVKESGRMRLICVYTGQPLDEQIFSDVKAAIGRGGIELEDVSGSPYCARGSSCVVVLLNKTAVPPSELSSALTERFALFADGLLPSFALAAVGAIRKNIHHMVTRFGSGLDSAYVANRLITNPPEDVAELVRELLVAECDNALGIESVADNYLDKAAVGAWLSKNESVFVEQSYGKKQKVDVALCSLLLKNGIDNVGAKNGSEKSVEFPVRHRNKVSIALAGGEASSKESEADFSRLVVFKREAFGDTKLIGGDGWRPSLTTGTLLRMQEGEAKRYFVCLTPACDTLRLSDETPFVFLEAAVDDSCYSLILREEEGVDRGLYFRGKHPTLMTYKFFPDSLSQRIRGEPHNADCGRPTFTFVTSSGAQRFTWLGEIRYARAASEMAKLAGNWMRIGINDSEYLRLIEAGKFK
ncbi:response regulator receiver domain [Stutzerimonas nitrititolerans]|uniref:response regulator receiver domain n=1 Tax=Stutzerimonas nitrititolerans TaxID=2482751 RepID=UPI00289ECE44|nr:response regulator receiver domain [Stutzerimonas nitrititolerans]